MTCTGTENCINNLNIPTRFFAEPETFFEYIGGGSYGKVYKYQGRVTEQTVAIKTPFDNSKVLCDLNEALLKEIKIHKELENPHIVCYFSAHKCKHTGKHHIIMEYMENKSLEDKLSAIFDDMNRSGTIPVLKTVKLLKYVEHILRGLVYLHSEIPDPIIHRDLRADNILLDDSDTAKLADFGISKRISESNTHESKNTKGHYLWMAPEILLKKEEHTGCGGDIWSLGIVILEMVFRHPDFFITYDNILGKHQLKEIHKNRIFKKNILKPLLGKIKSRDTRTLLNECLEDNVPDRKTSPELLHLVEQMKSNRRSSNLQPPSKK